MKITRRQFMKGSAVAGAYLAAGGAGALFMPRSAYAFYQTPSVIPLFGTSLRGIGTIGVAAWDGYDASNPAAFTPAPVTGVKHYTIDIDQFTDQILPDLGPNWKSTTLRGFNPARLLAGQNNRHLGGIIVAKGRAPGVTGDKAEPIQITFRNNLPGGMHIIPNDATIPSATGNNRTAVHFHGGLVPWISDGGPFDWWDPGGTHGQSFLNNNVLNPGAAFREAEYYYPMQQSARFGWYHDHAYGITRINAYAGIASGLLIRDAFEASLISKGLPNYIEAGGNEIPLVIQDKIFVGPNINQVDPNWQNVVATEAKNPGSLWYAHIYERNRWKSSGNLKGGNLVPPDPSCIPEFFGDTMLVNGTTFPKVTVEARRYRLRFLNACNARFLNLQFYVADTSPDGITLNALGNPLNGPALCDPNNRGVNAAVLQIGTEGGFLPYPVSVPTNVPFNPVTLTGSLLVAPAERPDILIDFSSYAGKSIILYNDAPAPFPVGDPRNDYFPAWNVAANPVNAATLPGNGPNSRVLMRFDVVAATTLPADLPLTITTLTDLQAGNDPLLIPPGGTLPTANTTRPLTLNETFDAYGRLQQLLGTNVALKGNSNFGRAYLDAPTEVVTLNKTTGKTTELWEIYNLTADVHPMHFHLVNVQVVNRQAFQNFNGTATFKAAATPPAPNETGWKETVPMYPGTVTRIIMTFDLSLAKIVGPTGVPINTTANPSTGQLAITGGMPPPSPRTGGNEYVWHCHILEHEEHDMMRPLVVM